MKISQDRIGNNNPIRKVLEDPVKKEEWLQKLRISKENSKHPVLGKTYEEYYGEKRAGEIRNVMRNSAINAAKNCPNRGMKNKKHSQETIEKLRKITAGRISSGVIKKISAPQKELFELLTKEILNINLN